MATTSQDQPLSLPERPRVIYAGQEKNFALWDKHKDTLRLLCLTKNLALKKVKHRMEVEHGFPVLTLNDYEIVLRDHFKFRKNVRSSDWAAIGHRIEKRKLAGKASNVYLCGQLMPPSKTKKGISRYGREGVSKQQVRRALSPLLPENITIRTPSPPPRRHITTLKAYTRDLAVCIPTEMPGVGLFPSDSQWMSDVSRLPDGNTRLEVINAIRLRSPFSTFVIILRDMFMPTKTTNQCPTNHTHQKSLKSDFPSLTVQRSSETVSHVSSPVKTESDEVVSQEKIINLATRGSNPCANQPRSVTFDHSFTPEFLSQACFILSNKIDMEGSFTRKLLDWVGISAELAILKSFFSIRSHTVTAVWENLLKSSLDLKHQRAFDVLLEVSISTNRHECILRRFGWTLCSAVRLRALHTVKRLMDLEMWPDAVNLSSYDDKETALEVAAELPQADMMEVLLYHGANANLQSIGRKECIDERHVSQTLLSLVCQLKSWKRPDSATCLRILHCVRILLHAGADVDVETPEANRLLFERQHCLSEPQLQDHLWLQSLGWSHGGHPRWLTDIAWVRLGGDHEIVQTLINNSNRVRHYITVPGIITQARAGLPHLKAYLEHRKFPSNAHDRIGLLEVALSEAAALGCLEAVVCLLQVGVDPNVGTLPDPDSEDAPINVRPEGHVENQHRIEKWEPASRALRQQHYNIVQALRENGASISLQRILEQALAHRKFDELLLLDISDADILATDGQLILGFLKHANQENFPVCARMCELLWSKGVPVDVQRDDQRDPLHLAIFHGCCLDMCKYLVHRGYKVHSNPSNAVGREPSSTMLWDAVTGGSEDTEEIIDFLLAHGADMNSPHHSETLLEAVLGDCRTKPGGRREYLTSSSSIAYRHLRIFEKLLDLGASVERRGKSGVLVRLLYLEVDDDLIFRVVGATKDVDQQGDPLSVALRQGRDAVVECLLSRGAKVHHQTVEGADPGKILGVACISPSCSEAMIERLIRLGAEVNPYPESEIRRFTPLQLAASHGKINVACLLMKHGVHINSILELPGDDAQKASVPVWVYRYTALDLAAREGRLDLVQLLRDAGGRSAVPGTIGLEGAIRHAEFHGFYSIVDFLQCG